MICVTLLLEKYVIFHRFILRFDKDDLSLHTDDCSLSFLASFKTGTGLTPVPPLSPPFYFLNFAIMLQFSQMRNLLPERWMMDDANRRVL